MTTFPVCLGVVPERAWRGRRLLWALAAALLLSACWGEKDTDPTSVQREESTRERMLADAARAAWVKANPDKNPDDNPTARVFMARMPNVVGLQDSAVLLDDGRLMAWEDLLAHRLDPDRPAPARKEPYVTGRSRDYAVLSDGTVRGGPFPGPLPTDVSAIAQGGNFTLLLRKNGTLWGFGGNEYGQLGSSANDPDHNPPHEVAKGLTKVTAIAAGLRHAIALKQDGSVWQWGLRDLNELQRNRYGRLPGPRRDGHFAPVPAQLASLSGIIQIVAGTGHNAALGRDGRVWAWGDEALPVAQSASTPVLVPGLQNIVALAAGHRHTLALDRDGAVWGWGTLSEYSMFPDAQLRAHVPGHPRKLGRLGPVSKIFTSFNLNAFVLRDQSLWYVGAGPWTMYPFGVRVPGQPGTQTRVQFAPSMKSGVAIGLYRIDDSIGRVNGLRPGQAGYAAAALAPGRTYPIDAKHVKRKFDAGQLLGFYLIRQGQAARTVQFSFPAANDGGVRHFSLSNQGSLLFARWGEAGAIEVRGLNIIPHSVVQQEALRAAGY